jgi:hypothetical protein
MSLLNVVDTASFDPKFKPMVTQMHMVAPIFHIYPHLTAN